MAVSSYESQYRKKEYLSAQTPWRVFILTLVIFLFTVFIFFGMIFGYKPYLKSKARNFEQKISVLSQNIDEVQQKQITTFFSQMMNIQTLIAGHRYYSSLFEFIERNTHNDTSYFNMKFTVADMDLKFEGVSKNYNSLINQLALFNQASEALKVSLDDSLAQEENIGIRFSIRLDLDKNMFKQPLIQQQPIVEATSTIQ